MMFASPAVRPASPGWTILAFTGEYQQQRNWCWAAACASINKYYCSLSDTGETRRRFRQCDIVANQCPGRDCCENPRLCDVQGYVDQALTFVGHLDREMEGAPPQFGGFDVIRREIDRHRPVAVRIQLRGGAEHFVVICGYGPDLRLLVWNPARGHIRTSLFSWLSDLGDWQNTYFTH